MTTTSTKDKVCLYDMLCAISVEQAKAFLTLQQEQGQLPEEDWVEQTEVPVGQLSGWVSEFADWLENKAAQPSVLNAEDPGDHTIGVTEFIQKLEDMPALYIKRSLISYFGEAIHNSWDGWQPYEGVLMERFMLDFVLSLSDDPKEQSDDTTSTLWGVTIQNTK